jgi:hypothetical protein
MIIPKQFQFRSDAEAEAVMKAWIREHYADLLGPKINLLDQPNGLALIEGEVKALLAARGIGRESIRRVA